jgi:hypothetical protein
MNSSCIECQRYLTSPPPAKYCMTECHVGKKFMKEHPELASNRNKEMQK